MERAGLLDAHGDNRAPGFHAFPDNRREVPLRPVGASRDEAAAGHEDEDRQRLLFDGATRGHRDDQVQALDYSAANQTSVALLLFSFLVLAITYGLQRRGIAVWPMH